MLKFQMNDLGVDWLEHKNVILNFLIGQRFHWHHAKRNPKNSWEREWVQEKIPQL